MLSDIQKLRKQAELSRSAYMYLTDTEQHLAEQLHLAAHDEMRTAFPAPMFSRMATYFTLNKITLYKEPDASIGETAISKADHMLQADIEALKQAQASTEAALVQQRKDIIKHINDNIDALAERLSNLEFAASPAVYIPSQLTADQARAIKRFNEAVKQQLKKELRPGGLLHDHLL